MRDKGEGVVVLIGLFKLAKCALLIAIALAGILGLQENAASALLRVIAATGGFSGRHTIARLVGALWALDDRAAERWGGLSAFYAAIFATEGVGLLRRKHWAEWLTVATTASFVPIELYELAKRFVPTKLLALILNLAILAYLLWLRLRGHRRPASNGQGAAAQ
jgi:uncharacterized membrane protein (DUF2068 family)